MTAPPTHRPKADATGWPLWEKRATGRSVGQNILGGLIGCRIERGTAPVDNPFSACPT